MSLTLDSGQYKRVPYSCNEAFVLPVPLASLFSAKYLGRIHSSESEIILCEVELAEDQSYPTQPQDVWSNISSTF